MRPPNSGINGGNVSIQGDSIPFDRGPSTPTLAMVIDAWSRSVVGWSMADHLRTELIIDALEMALWRRAGTGRDLVFGDAHDNAVAGELLRHSGDRAHRPHRLAYARRRAAGCSTSSSLVQPAPASLVHRVAVAGRVREVGPDPPAWPSASAEVTEPGQLQCS